MTPKKTIWEVDVFHNVSKYEYVRRDRVDKLECLRYDSPEHGNTVFICADLIGDLAGIGMWENMYFRTRKEAVKYTKTQVKMGHGCLQITNVNRVIHQGMVLNMTIKARNKDTVITITGKECKEMIDLSNTTLPFSLIGSDEGWRIGILYLPIFIEVIITDR